MSAASFGQQQGLIESVLRNRFNEAIHTGLRVSGLGFGRSPQAGFGPLPEWLTEPGLETGSRSGPGEVAHREYARLS